MGPPYSTVHHNIGEAWRRHALLLPIPALRSLVTEHNAWLRGRAVHQQTPACFVIYAAFALSHGWAVARTTSHHRRSTQLPRDED